MYSAHLLYVQTFEHVRLQERKKYGHAQFNVINILDNVVQSEIYLNII